MKTIKNLTAEEIRKSILQLAIQGKLVKQNPNDEPASELVKKIYGEKKKLIAEGKIKKDKNESYIYKGDDNCYYEKIGKSETVKLDDLPFDIPDNWTWVRHNSIYEIFGGSQPPKDKFIPMPKDGYIRLYQIRDYGPKPDPVYIPIKDAHKTTKKGDILLARYGASVGKIFFAEDGAYNVAMAKVEKLYNGNYVNKQYLYTFYKSNLYQSLVLNNSRSAQAGFNKEDLNDLLIPLPPLEEQQRIVDKINSFEPLLLEYESYEKKLTELEEGFADKLKKSILQYAIEGKLVKQDPNDEPASVLLERIKAEKEKLIKEGKIKRDKNESYIYQGDDKNYYEKSNKTECLISDDFIYRLPNFMLKQRFKTVLDVRDGTHESPAYYSNGYPFISSKNLNNGEIDYLNIKYISKENFDKYNIRSNAEEGDILFGMIGTIGNPSIIKNPPFKFSFKNMALIKMSKQIYLSEYVYYYLLWIERKFKQEASGGIQQFISLDYIRNSIIPVPSIKYQIKVVNKLKLILSY